MYLFSKIYDVTMNIIVDHVEAPSNEKTKFNYCNLKKVESKVWMTLSGSLKD